MTALDLQGQEGAYRSPNQRRLPPSPENVLQSFCWLKSGRLGRISARLISMHGSSPKGKPNGWALRSIRSALFWILQRNPKDEVA